jgi:hypothetical protein
MNETSRVIYSIHLAVCQSFAEEVVLFEAPLLTLTIGETDVLMLRVSQSALWVVFVSAEIVEELLVSFGRCHVTLIFDIFVSDLRHSERIWLGVLVISAQNTATHDVFVQNICEAHPSHHIALRDLKSNRATFE